MATRFRSAVRTADRRGTRDDKSPRVARAGRPPSEGTICMGCRAVFRRKTWRRRRLDFDAWLTGARGFCPACRQVFRHESYGQVIVPGPIRPGDLAAIVRRVRNVAARARFTQPERRLVAVDAGSNGISIYTTSQKLAHRVAEELRKAFGGRTSYSWSDRDGRLRVSWDGPAQRQARDT